MRISVVTVHRNEFTGLIRTLESVTALRARLDLQWIVIDGLSSWPDDGSFERVRGAADVFVTEGDAGLYDAMNKGVALAKGVFVVFMNAGDTFAERSFEALSAALQRDECVDLVCFNSYEAAVGDIPQLKRARSPHWIWYGMPGHHQAMLFRTRALPSPAYDLRFRIAADYALVCRLYREKRRIELVDLPLCVFELGGLSSQRRVLGLAEQQAIRTEFLGVPPLVNYLLGLLKQGIAVVRDVFPAAYAFVRYRG